MRKEPAISVCMPFYNVEHYIEEAIESVLNQSFRDFELILINDGSTDNSVQIAQKYTDERIFLINNPHGFIDSLNAGLDRAKGKYIARMDADDKMHPDRLLIQYNYMEYNPEIAACGAGLKRFGSSEAAYIPMILDSDEIELAFTKANCFTIGVIRTDFLRTHNIRYNKRFIYAEDYRLWADIVLAGGKLCNLPQILYYYRVHDRQISVVFDDQMRNNSYIIRKDVINYLLNRDNMKYMKVCSINSILKDLYIQQIIELKDYCEVMSHLIEN
ncbi:glycosyltransferase family 2 protein [Parabacteroides faecis]|uniref:Glycosyltransferase involved in cell wall biosynthesis n=1 Tax=Parabacteroides faecis TaxID=1217282 RepID=A0ABR6KGI4_9BACT|nr:glycosyltransferase family 2 protein [Parabacteroides faecis]MBB4620598.1 glycosyltransferase involved in cell wall biosynthesis [Parabacteroides faecis]GGK06046.1 glycosyl transferase [Parabacteroides faecis]